jgi:hypothetical protein
LNGASGWPRRWFIPSRLGSNTEELRDWFIAELGEKEGARQWSEFLDLVGAASPGSKVPANTKNATQMRQRLKGCQRI